MKRKLITVIEFTDEDFTSRRLIGRSRRCLELKIGSFYIPKDKPGKPLGEDAHFISENNQTFGFADGVGGWAKHGIDSGLYARELMKNASDFIIDQPTGTIDPTEVLIEAFFETESKGSSTACIVTLKGDLLQAVNIGDSGFVVIRDGKIVFQTKPQQHRFNHPYQLGLAFKSDDPSRADEIFYQVERGDVIVAGTDGLFDNVYPSEIEDLIENCRREDESPEGMACMLAMVALAQSLFKDTVSPFTRAAMDAGYDSIKYKGGKYDDITVIVADVV